MSAQTILVIDDSATIRKMVDSNLSQEGYRVVLAPDGETGIQTARDIIPDLILLDHQLPGMLGIDVCRKILEFPECQQIPFVVSSTLRKQAYVEYMDVPNVVDSLPKPFKPELLRMTVENALETGAMIVSSQANGTAVPEVVGGTDQPALSGDFKWMGVREVIDFLNNGRKEGMLEIETKHNRVCFFLKDGRIQGVVSASFDAQEVASQLPESMKELAPLLQFTMSSGSSTRVDGLVELMDKKVLDPRLLRTLLRHQSAVLTRYCFLNNPVTFSFLPEQPLPSLFRKASIDSCLAALLIDGAMLGIGPDHQSSCDQGGWIRNGLRGQNLDRAGLSAGHVQLLSLLNSAPLTAEDISGRTRLPVHEVHAVLEGLLLAEWAETQPIVLARTLIAFEPDAVSADILRSVIEDPGSGWTGNVVRDEFSLQLLLRRRQPDAIVVAAVGETEFGLPEKIRGSEALNRDGVQVTVILPEDSGETPIANELLQYPTLRRPFDAKTIVDALSKPQSAADFPAPAVAAGEPEVAAIH